MREPVYDRWGVTVHHGDNLDVLREMPDCSVDSVVTDPPAGIGFLREWDSDRGGREQWVAWLAERMREALRVLKPGGHALVWGLPRTSHWTGLALEDAGFEIRDVIQHTFDNNGFPKSLNIAQAIDQAGGVSPAQQGLVLRAARARAGLTRQDVARAIGCTAGSVGDWEDGRSRAVGKAREVCTPSRGYREKLADLLGYTEDERRAVGLFEHGGRIPFEGGWRQIDYGAPRSDAAKSWQGWGTALRPAAEPWWLCRRAPNGTVVANVLEFGTGGLNIAAVRDDRWPGNTVSIPKPAPAEAPMVNGERHPTVKSVRLMRHFARLVTPPGGTVLDLFAGTGPVGQAARAEGMKAVLIEQDEQSIGFIRARLDARVKTEAGAATADGEPIDLLDLLGGDAS